MESLDWTQLAGNVEPDTSRIPYEPNKHLFRKVAFDVFQLSSSPVESLWALEDGEDGAQFLVAKYVEEGSETIEVKSHWEALSDREGKNVTLMYKSAAIQRFASSNHGFSTEDVHLFQQTLVEKLGSDKKFVSKLLQSQQKAKLDLLISQFPELQALAADYPGHPDDEDISGDFNPEDYLAPDHQGPSMEDEPKEGSKDKLDHLVNVMSTTFHKAVQSFEQNGEEMGSLSSEDIDYFLNQLRQEIR